MERTCSSCGAPLREGVRFCKVCGAQAAPASLCSCCGAVLGDGAQFCKICGAQAASKSAVCSFCGTQLKPRATSCDSCGAPATPASPIPVPDADGFGGNHIPEPEPEPLCPDCGCVVREGAAFCKSCGAALTEAVGQRRPAPRKSSTSRPSRQTAPAAGATSEKKRRRVFPRIVAAALVIALVVGGLRYVRIRREPPVDYGGGYGGEYGGYETSGGAAKPVSADVSCSAFLPEYTDAEVAGAPTVQLPVSPEATFARDEDVEVDFGEYNLLEQTSLSVSRLPNKSVALGGLSVTAYDLSMANGINAFSLPVSVTLPLTCAPDEVSDIRVFNESTGVWEAVPSVADYEAGTITFRTTHFCTIAELKMKGSRLQDMVDAMPLQNGYFTYAGDFDSTGALTPVTLPMSAFVKLVEDSADSGDSIMHTLEKGRVDPDDIFSTMMRLGDTAAGTYEEGFAFMQWADDYSGNTFGKISRAFQVLGAAILVARMSYQAYNGVAVGDILWNNAPDIAAVACTAYGIVYAYPPALVAATVIFALNAIYDFAEGISQMSDAERQMELAYRTFCGTVDEVFASQSCVMFNADTLELTVDYSKERFAQSPGAGTVQRVRLDPGGAGMTAAINVIFERYAEQPEALNAAVTKLLDDYVKLFFRQSDEAVIKYLDDYSILHDVTKKPSAEQIKGFEERFRSHLYGKTAPIFKEFAKKATDELMTRLYNDVVPDLLEQLNTVVSFEIVDSALGGDTFDNSVYAGSGYTISFDYNDGRWDNQRAKNYEQIKSRCIFAPQNGSNEVFSCNVYSLMQLDFPSAITITSTDPEMSEYIRLPFELEAPVTAVLIEDVNYTGLYTGLSGGRKEGGTSFELQYPALRVEHVGDQLIVCPAMENGDYEAENTVTLTFNAAAKEWRGTLLLEEAGQWTEMVWELRLSQSGGGQKSLTAVYAQTFGSRTGVYIYGYELNYSGPLKGTALDSRPASTESQGTPVGGVPVGGIPVGGIPVGGG